MRITASQQEPSKRKEFQKRTDEDIDSFLSKKDFARSQQTPTKSAAGYSQPASTTPPPPPPVESPKQEQKPAEAKEPDHDEQIRAARSSRAEAEAYHDVAVLRKKAHALDHKAAKFYHRYRANEAKAQKCSAKAVAYREKAALHKERARTNMDREKEYEAELGGAAQGKSDLSPESIRTKMATAQRKAAKQEEISRRNESKAAAQTAKGAKFKSRAAKYLEQNKVFESEAKMYAKRADNLERAGV